MRKIICTSQLFIVLLVFALASNQSFSQTQFKCNSDSLYDDVMQNDSIFFENENLMNLKIRDAFLNNTILSAKSGSSLLPEFTIPVVVHVIYDVDDQNNLALNISYAQIESQIAKLNSIFASIGTPTRYDSDIKFCLAKSPSNFFPTAEPGVIRYAVPNGAPNVYNFQETPAAFNDVYNMLPIGFVKENYLNIFLVYNFANNALNIGNYYGGHDVIFIKLGAFGDNEPNPGLYTLLPDLEKGFTAVHEVGHYLGLRHTFHGGCQGTNGPGQTPDDCLLNGDNLCDTPPCTQNFYQCTWNIPNSCNEQYFALPPNNRDDLIDNFMSYSYECAKNNFSNDQIDRMRFILGLLRFDLVSNENLAETGVIGLTSCLPPIFFSDVFLTTELVPCLPAAGSITLDFASTSTLFPAASTATNLTWVITPSIGTTSTTTTAGFQVTFTVAGTYSISLSSTDPANGTVTTNAIQVFIVNCGLPARPEHAVWCYQRSVHLDFTTGIALSTPPNSSISNPLSPFSSTSQCDPITGNLHFYTDGIRVWNNNNALIGNITNSNYGTNIKGTISVPNPNNFDANPLTRTNNYYIFTVPAYGQSGNGSLVFGEVAINAGIASLISSNNTLPAGIFNTNVVEAITAIPHCNGIDTWIIVHEINSSNTISYLLTGSGISLAVQNSSLPFINSNPGLTRHRFTIESAPHGDAMAIFNWANETVYFYSFNNTNGQMTYTSSVVIPLGSANTQLHGSFAPNTGGGSYFYYAVNSSTNSLFQIELPTLNTPIIQNIPFSLGSPLRQLDGSIQLGPDNLIYLSSFTQNNFGDSKMLVIRAPNVSGPGVAGCNPVVNLNNFTIGQRNFFSLPNLVDATRNPSLPLDFLAVASNCSTYTFSVGTCWSQYNVTWNFGDGTQTISGSSVSHTYLNDGQFQVTCTLTLGTTTLSFTSQTVSVITVIPTITQPSNGCISTINPFEFSVPFFAGATYSWTTSQGTMTPHPNDPNIASPNWTTHGNYTVTVTMTSQNCSFTSTINFSAYYCCTTNIGNVLFNPTFTSGQIISQTFTINGTAMIDGSVHLVGCTLKMGPKAKIRIKPNSLLIIDQFTQISACAGEMWDGIDIVDNTGRLTIRQSRIEDAVNAIEALNGANSIQCDESEFRNNWVSVNLENGNYIASHFDGNIFTSDASQMLAPHAAQVGRAGFQLRNIFTNTYVRVGPAALNASNGNLFQNLQYGIDSYNCSIISNNNNFLNIVEQASPFSQTPWNGTGIFAENASWSFGNASTNTIEVYENFFNDCKRGVFVNKNSNVIIDADNEFYNCSYAAVELKNLRQQNALVRNSKVFDLGAFGFRFIDCLQMNNITVIFNQISMTPGTPANPLGSSPGFSYFNTAMFFKNTGQLNANALISYNTITDARIGISVQGYAQFSLSNNTINLVRDENQFSGLLHQGIEIMNSTRGMIDWNNISYTNSLNNTSLNYKDLFLGFNLRNISNSDIMHNTITRAGTAMRFLGNVTYNDILCNSMDDCALGWFFNNSQVSPIGIPGIPFENEFVNFSNRARSDRDANASITALYFPGDEVDLNNIYTAWPYTTTGVINPIPNQPWQNICSGIAAPDPTEDMSYMEKVILDSIQYPVLYEINRDRDLQSTYRRYRSSPDSSYAAYANWFEQLENGRIGLTAKLIEAHINLDSIRILLDGLSDESNPIFNQLRELYEVVLYNLDHPDNPIPHDTSFLYQLAFMDEWNGTEAVYMARAILELEVNDFLLGLRTMQPLSSADNMCDDLLKFYNSYIVIPVKSSPIQLEYFDKVGRLIFQEKTTEDLGAEKIKLLKSKAVFLIRARQGNCIKVYKLP